MTVDQLRQLMEEAARDLASRSERPFPVTVVLPLEGATRVTTLEGFPDDDVERTDALSVFAAREMVPRNAPCFGLLAEADGPGGEDLLLVAYGARRHSTQVTACVIGQDGSLGEFLPPEPLDPAALPFVKPLQHAADLAAAG